MIMIRDCFGFGGEIEGSVLDFGGSVDEQFLWRRVDGCVGGGGGLGGGG